jgi:hypothetical protein
MSITFPFVCDSCGYYCLLTLHYSGILNGYKCPRCEKYFEVVNQLAGDVEKPEFIGTEALPNIDENSMLIGYECLKHVPSGRSF